MKDAKSKNLPNLLGVLGGMGPAATIDFLHKVLENTRAETDQEQIPTITYNNCRIPDRNDAYLRNGASPVPELKRSAKVLEQAGADLIAIPCNTAHIWYKEISEGTSVEVLNMPEITAKAIPEGSSVGIISTTPVRLSGLFSEKIEKRGGTALYHDNQESIMKAIYSVKAGRLELAREEFLSIISDLEAKGAEHILAGCTEVPVVIGKGDTRGTLIDPMVSLAVECARRFSQNQE